MLPNLYATCHAVYAAREDTAWRVKLLQAPPEERRFLVEVAGRQVVKKDRSRPLVRKTLTFSTDSLLTVLGAVCYNIIWLTLAW